MTYKRRVGPRNYSRKAGKPPLPVLGKGARYEFIDETPVVQAVVSESPLGTTKAASRPLRARVQKMSAGTLPTPSLRAGSLLYTFNPRTTVQRHADMRAQVPARQSEMMPVRAPPGGSWNQLLGAAQQEQLVAISGTNVQNPEPTNVTPAISYASSQTIPARIEYQTHSYNPVPLMQLPTPAHSQITYTAGGYPAYPYPSYHVPTSTVGRNGGAVLKPLTDVRDLDEVSSGGLRSGEALESKDSEGSFGGRIEDGDAELTVDIRPSLETTMHSVRSMNGTGSAGERAGAGGGEGMIVKVEDCDEPDCWS